MTILFMGQWLRQAHCAEAISVALPMAMDEAAATVTATAEEEEEEEEKPVSVIATDSTIPFR